METGSQGRSTADDTLNRAGRRDRASLSREAGTRAALVEHFAEGKLVHPAALLAPSTDDVRSWVGRYTSVDNGLEDADDVPDTLEDQLSGGEIVDHSAAEEEADEGFREAAE